MDKDDKSDQEGEEATLKYGVKTSLMKSEEKKQMPEMMCPYVELYQDWIAPK